MNSTQDIANRQLRFDAAAIPLSYANRFSFPDSMLGNRAGYNPTDLIANSLSRKNPLSSEVIALRYAVFHPKPPPKIVRKLVYVARGPRGSRAALKLIEKWIQSRSDWIADESIFTDDLFRLLRSRSTRALFGKS